MPDTADETASSEPRRTQKARLVTGSIPRHMVTQTAPLIVGVAAIMSVGIIDAYFIGQLGADALAAVAFIFPVTTALSSLGVGVMAGISSVVSRALGKGNMDHARGLAAMGIGVAAGLGLVLAAALFIGRVPLFELMQAQDTLLPLIDAYMRPYAMFYPLQLLMMGANGALRGQGLARHSMAILITFAVVNWLLDPVLINGAFGMAGYGIAGAAYASIGGFASAMAMGLVLLARSRIGLSVSALRHAGLGDALALARVTGPAAFSNSINPIGLSVLTGFLAAEGQAAVAGFGAAGRLQSFAVVPLLGLSGAIGAIVGQNWGAECHGRVRHAAMLAAGFCVAYGTAVGLALFLARDALARLFTDDPAVIAALTDYVEIGVWGYGGYGLLIASNGALNAVDHAGLALLQSLLRVLAIMVPVAWILQSAWGADAVYTAELAANVVGGAIAAGAAYWVLVRKRGSAAGQSGA
ncbi:MATE family efflux transporter [Croceicoccus sp. YJ47]|uniref:MATE family efflux transporter n=1 Tax=Croceicoccus sp. YJ47 TaxID=2798724 RepID=UPI001923AE9C|nr:MATE family efflux transporter [Croceicoccus sp. YJ47]QQN74867.1 MATE family efflux transporter [Croceicoccus sp. YJ47]